MVDARRGIPGQQARLIAPGVPAKEADLIMWWLVGLAIYLFLLLVASLFMYGASRLQDEIPHNQARGGKAPRERRSSKTAPQQLPLPFTPSR